MLSKEEARALLEREYGAVARSVRRVANRRGLTSAEFEEYRSYVMVKLVEDDYRRIRKFQARGSFDAYIAVVVGRLLLDLRVEQWGKWRNSRRARKLGATALALETLVYRDGFSFAEAVEVLDAAGRASREGLWTLYRKLPCRVRCSFVSEAPLANMGTEPPDPIVAQEDARLGAEAVECLCQSWNKLDSEDRRILHLRFAEGMTVPRIADTLRVEGRGLYARIQRLLSGFRRDMEASGLDAQSARAAASVPFLSRLS